MENHVIYDITYNNTGIPTSIALTIPMLPKGKFAAREKYIPKDDLTCKVKFEFPVKKGRDWDTLVEAEYMSFNSYADYYINGHRKYYGQTPPIERFPIKYRDKIKEIIDFVKKYKGKDMFAGTKAQTEYLEENELSQRSYDEKIVFLKARDLYVDRGYQYGSAWLVDPLPIEKANYIINIIIELKNEIEEGSLS